MHFRDLGLDFLQFLCQACFLGSNVYEPFEGQVEIAKLQVQAWRAFGRLETRIQFERLRVQQQFQHRYVLGCDFCQRLEDELCLFARGNVRFAAEVPALGDEFEPGVDRLQGGGLESEVGPEVGTHFEVLPPANANGYLKALQEVINRYEIQFLIPGSEPELIKIYQNHDYFSECKAKILINRPEVVHICLNKNLTFEFLTKHGFVVPRTLTLDSTRMPEKFPFQFPCIIKPAQGGGGSASVFIAQDMEELDFFAHYLIRNDCRPLVQEYIPTAESEYTVGVLHDPEGKLIGTAVLLRQIITGLSNRLKIKNRTQRQELGETLAISSGISQGWLVSFDPVRRQAEAMANALKSTGPLNIQGRWNGRDFVPFEINPRFSGTTPMRALAGFNEPELLIEWHLGLPARTPQVRLGEFTRGLVEFFIPETTGPT